MGHVLYHNKDDVAYAFESLMAQKHTFESGMPTRSEIESSELILYGAGNMGLATILWLNGRGLKIKCLIDKNEQKRGEYVNGFPVLLPEDISAEDKENCVFLVCVVTIPYSDIQSLLHQIGCIKIYPVWDVIDLFNEGNNILCGWNLPKMSEDDVISCNRLFTVLGDEVSKAHYFQALCWRIRREEVLIDYAPIQRENKYFPCDIPVFFLEDEVFVDCGAFNGSTIATFIKRTNDRFKKIYAFEPSSEGFAALSDFISNHNLAGRAEIFQTGIGANDETAFFNDLMGDESHFTRTKSEIIRPRAKLDTILDGKHFTYLKIHIEGDDFDAIIGGMKTITEQRPIIAVTIFHNRSNFIDIPELLTARLSEYSFFLRAYCYCGIETVFYAIPNERIK